LDDLTGWAGSAGTDCTIVLSSLLAAAGMVLSGASPSSPSSWIRATVVPTATVSPSENSSSSTFPATGEGISALTLAVLTSKRTSSS